MKIYSATDKSKFRIKWVESAYTGGNIDIAWGQLTNGDYFTASSLNYDVYIVDANPGEEHNAPNEYDGTMYGDDWGWIEEHTTVQLSEREQIDFWIYLLQYCQRKGIELLTYESPSATIKELKEMRDEY